MSEPRIEVARGHVLLEYPLAAHEIQIVAERGTFRLLMSAGMAQTVAERMMAAAVVARHERVRIELESAKLPTEDTSPTPVCTRAGKP